jgi:predicted alpha/beta superfamily hydrolase
MPGWKPFRGATVVGDVRVLRDVASPQLGNTRDLYVYLPPGHAAGAGRFPVVYMQDGQNLFDDETSFSGEWRVDETMEMLAREGIEAIVVGVSNADEARADEYSVARGRGREYLRFLADTVKPRVDRDFRTLPAREATGLVGSSLGGLISLYGVFLEPGVFGFAGALSPALWYARRAVFRIVGRAPFADARIYLDVGEDELPGERAKTRRYVADVTRMANLLESKGYGPDRLRLVVEPGGTHHERHWARRLPDALRFLLG